MIILNNTQKTNNNFEIMSDFESPLSYEMLKIFRIKYKISCNKNQNYRTPHVKD